MGEESAEANVKTATTPPEPVVTDPAEEDDGPRTNPFVLYPLIIIWVYTFVLYVNISGGVPLWEAFAWSAGEALIFLIPIWGILKTIDDINRYAKERSEDGTGGDLSTNLLGHEIV
ncbi:unnamed protein product [Urochloa humidicola]